MRYLLLSVVGACTRQGFEPLDLPIAGEPPPAWCAAGVAARVLPGGQTWSNLQDALVNAPDIARVEVCPGVHYGGFFDAQVRTRLQLVGVTTNPRDVVLDGSNTDLILNLRHTDQVSIDGITFQNGTDGDPNENVAALTTGYGTGLWLNRIIFQDNTSSSGVAGFSSPMYADIRISNTSFIRNEGYSGGAANFSVHLGPGATLTNVLFEDNSVSFGGTPGLYIGGNATGVLYGLPRPLYTLTNVQFVDNISPQRGDAALAFSNCYGGLDAVIRDGLFDGNSGSEYGALSVGVGLQDYVRVRLEDTWFTGNAGTVTAAMHLNNFASTRGATTGDFRMTGGGFLRNTTDPNFLDRSTVNNEGAWRMGFRDVDFGSGVDANASPDLDTCNQDYGPGTYGVVDTSIRNHGCLSWPP